ncbi:MAG: GyrI-like domain-containing protein [Nitrososphaerales archaeon]|jgi:hypothetical protein
MTSNPAKKVDLRKQLKYLYSPSASEPQTVDVPRFNFILIDGKGDPNGAGFSDAINALYSLSYTLKFAVKKEKAIDYPVMALEALWWTDSGRFDMADRDRWNWTAMMMQPKLVTPALYRRAVEEVRKKKEIKALGVARLEAFHEGLSAQIMHVGPYSAEGPTIERLHGYIKKSGGRPKGEHHEIYLGDPRRAAPSKLQTIVRQPFEKSA